MNAYYSDRSSRPAGLVSFSLPEGPQVRLCCLLLRETPAASGLSGFATAFMNHPG